MYDVRWIFQNYQLSIVNCQLSIVNYQLSIVNYQLSIINYQLSIINYQLSIISLLHLFPVRYDRKVLFLLQVHHSTRT